MHEETFIELAGGFASESELYSDGGRRATFLAVLKEEKLELLYVEFPVEQGTLSK